MMRTLVFLAIVWLLPRQVQSQNQSQVEELYDKLLKGIHKNIRPAVNHSDPTEVNVTFSLFQILDIDIAMGKLTISGELVMEWYDHRMSWNPLDYGGLDSINVPSSATWKPDLVLKDPFDNSIAFGDMQNYVNVRYLYDGKAIFAPAGVISSACNITVMYYPFDAQKCETIFYPRGNNNQEMVFNTNTTELSESFFSKDPQWILDRNETSTGVMFDNVCFYRVVLYLQRRSGFIFMNIIYPTIYITLLNACVFVLPASSGERVSFAVTVLLAFVFYMTIVSDNLPQSSQPMPIICYILLSNFLISTSILVITILNLRLYHHQPGDKVHSMVENLKYKFRASTYQNLSKRFDVIFTIFFLSWGFLNCVLIIVIMFVS